MADNYPDLDLHKIQISEIIGDSLGFMNQNATDIENNINPIADAIISREQSGIWDIVKYQSGHMTATGAMPTANYNINNASAGMYYLSINSLTAFPSGFIAKPVVGITPSVESNGLLTAAYVWGVQTTATKLGVVLCAMAPQTLGISFHLVCDGYWE